MPEDDEGIFSKSGYYRCPDTSSPDSLIFTHDSTFSLFSSASVSVDRCSFTSDHDSLASEISLQLAGGGSSGGGNEFQETSSRSDPNKMLSIVQSKHHAHAPSRCLFKKVEKAKLRKEENNKATTIQLLEDHSGHLIDSATNSFSLALRECQERKCRSEVVSKKADRRRTSSMDLNSVISAAVVAESPRLSATKTSGVSSRKSSTFDSPVGTPHATAVGMQKGWNSERVALHNHSSNRRQQVNGNNASSFLHFSNTNGRTLPSKWEDAERWIFSPVSVDGGTRTSSQVLQRKPKSKSGPLGPPGIAYYSLYSPVFSGGNMGNFMPAGSSPVSPGLIVADGFGIRSNCNNSAKTERCMPRSASVHGFSEVGAQPSSTSQDEKVDDVKNGATDLSCISRRDMATQMSPEVSSSNHSSPSKRLSFSAILPILEVQSINSSKSEVRDVEVDERVTVTRWSKRHRSRNRGKNSKIVDDSRKKSVDVKSSDGDVSEAEKIISEDKREEAKITAWENLQKAKAEAAIRKLEMKLEKKRSSSMDKIMNKLRSAQKKAQEMRNSVSTNQAHQVPKTPHKAISFRKTRQMGSLSGCFTCQAF